MGLRCEVKLVLQISICHNFVPIGCSPWGFNSNEQPGCYIVFTEYQITGGEHYILYHFEMGG